MYIIAFIYIISFMKGRALARVGCKEKIAVRFEKDKPSTYIYKVETNLYISVYHLAQYEKKMKQKTRPK